MVLVCSNDAHGLATQTSGKIQPGDFVTLRVRRLAAPREELWRQGEAAEQIEFGDCLLRSFGLKHPELVMLAC